MSEVPTPPPVIPRADLEAFLAPTGVGRNKDLLLDILRTTVGLATDDVDRLDLKIVASALSEMRAAFAAFAPYRERPKVTMFGSARTKPEDPLYDQARRLAAELARQGWMVVTGAGPGIMAAGMEGAGRENSFGVTIRLPFEDAANEFIFGDEKLVAMKYFFTRKLMLVKESDGFVALPGGFGTQDETFELFTLQQTGKGVPAPVVLLDTPGGTYWHKWLEFVQEELVGGGLINEVDLGLFKITDDIAVASREILGFYRNYHSIRWAGDTLIVRMKQGPDATQLAELNHQFAHLVVEGEIEASGPTKGEISTADHVDLDRIVLQFNKFRAAEIQSLARAVNAWVAG